MAAELKRAQPPENAIEEPNPRDNAWPKAGGATDASYGCLSSSRLASESAAQCIDEAIRLAPDRITLKTTKAALLIEHGNIDAGISLLDELNRQQQAEPDQALCSYYLAYVLLKKGDSSGATEKLRKSKSQYPKSPVAVRIELKIVDVLIKTPLPSQPV